MNHRSDIPFAFSKRNGVLVVAQQDGYAQVIQSEVSDPISLIELRRFMGVPLRVEKVDSNRFNAQLQQQYEGGSSAVMEEMDGLSADTQDFEDLSELIPEPEDLMESDDDAPIIRLINAILSEAIRQGASDIHIEPFENRMRVRFRIDGMLREMLAPKKALVSPVVSRIKVMAKLDIAEKRLPQDGRISLRLAGRAVDVRVSTLPSGHGERVVLRLLEKENGRLDLKTLGLSDHDRQRLDKIIHHPHGVFLVTGPTGSGKSTTLYSALSLLNQSDRSIMTVEDPVEYFIDGVSQTAVNTKIDMNFARGLRAILRQDPDIVMVGEIRDVETAEVAVQASLTGHLVLSTLHTNTAVGAVTRLRDMGVEPFMLASSLLGVLAQRLVRKLCIHCKEPYQADQASCDLLETDSVPAPTLYRAIGCEHCYQTGFSGRIGIFELVEVDNTMREAIHNGAGEIELEKLARQQTQSIRTSGAASVLSGDTTIDEIIRVTRES
ncbi:MAG: type II secretion system ATPase GspE [Pseudomonadales bacterium]|nr:type II secretion system ATPase GspE [Pseudomonadales bacterium]